MSKEEREKRLIVDIPPTPEASRMEYVARVEKFLRETLDELEEIKKGNKPAVSVSLLEFEQSLRYALKLVASAKITKENPLGDEDALHQLAGIMPSLEQIKLLLDQQVGVINNTRAAGKEPSGDLPGGTSAKASFVNPEMPSVDVDTSKFLFLNRKKPQQLDS